MIFSNASIYTHSYLIKTCINNHSKSLNLFKYFIKYSKNSKILLQVKIAFFYCDVFKCNLFCDAKLSFQQSSVSHDLSEILIIAYWFTAQERFLIINGAKWQLWSLLISLMYVYTHTHTVHRGDLYCIRSNLWSLVHIMWIIKWQMRHSVSASYCKLSHLLGIKVDTWYILHKGNMCWTGVFWIAIT